MTEIEDAASLVQRFGWPDYLVFAAMLAISAVIGIYYACVGGKQNSTSEFLMAGRNMGTFPVAMSLIARYVKQKLTEGETLTYKLSTKQMKISFFFILKRKPNNRNFRFPFISLNNQNKVFCVRLAYI